PRAELPRHRSLPGGDRALSRPHGARPLERQDVRLPDAHHRSDARDAVRQQGRDAHLKRYKEFNAAQHSADSKFECANKTAALVTETAMAWHLEAVGSQGQRGTGDPK